MLTGAPYASACRLNPAGAVSRSSPRSQVMLHVSAGAPGKGGPRRKRAVREAPGATAGEAGRVPRCVSRRKGGGRGVRTVQGEEVRDVAADGAEGSVGGWVTQMDVGALEVREGVRGGGVEGAEDVLDGVDDCARVS